MGGIITDHKAIYPHACSLSPFSYRTLPNSWAASLMADKLPKGRRFSQKVWTNLQPCLTSQKVGIAVCNPFL